MAVPCSVKAQEGENEQVQSQNHVDLLLRQQRGGSQRVRTTWTDRKSSILPQCVGKVTTKGAQSASRDREDLGSASRQCSLPCCIQCLSRHFDAVEDIKKPVTRVLGEVPQEVFQNCFENWKARWNEFIGAGGDYSEGDHSDVPQYLNIGT